MDRSQPLIHRGEHATVFASQQNKVGIRDLVCALLSLSPACPDTTRRPARMCAAEGRKQLSAEASRISPKLPPQREGGNEPAPLV